ncbi:hypothetical protein Tco_1327350 [Tanacetum coccineum]
MALVQDGRDKIVISRLLLVNQARKCHVEERKAQGLMKFTLSVLSKEAQSSNHTDATLAIRTKGCSVESQRDDHSNDVPSEIPEPRKDKRVRKAKSYGSDFQLYLVKGSRDQVGSQYSYCYSIEEDPRTYDEAMQSRDAAFWKEAIDDEIGSIMENNTWVLSDLPS